MKKNYFYLAIFIMLYIFVVINNQADWDLWARLAVGKVFFQIGHVLPHDIFAYTDVKPLWVDHEWGTGVILYFLAHFFGDFGLNTLKLGIVAGIFFFLYTLNQRRKEGSNEENPYRIGFYAIWGATLGFPFGTTLRSQAFTYFFFAMWLYWLDLLRAGSSKVKWWFFPLTMLVWANVHGGFLSGLGIMGLFIVSEILCKRPWKIYLKPFVSSFAVTFINPYGVKYWTYLIHAVSMPRPFVSEWSPLNLQEFFYNPAYLTSIKLISLLFVLSIPYLLIKRPKNYFLSDFLIILATLYMGISHVRHISFFIIAIFAYSYYWIYPAFNWYTSPVSNWIKNTLPQQLRALFLNGRDAIVYTVIFFVGLIIMLFMPFNVSVSNKVFPVNAVKFMQVNHISGNLLVLFNWGSYAHWKLYPQCKIAVDGRYEETYTDKLIDEVARFHYNGKNWDDLLRNYHTDAILVPKDYDIYRDRLIYLKDWIIAYHDDSSALFVRKSQYRLDYKPIPKNFDINKEKYQSNIVVPENLR